MLGNVYNTFTLHTHWRFDGSRPVLIVDYSYGKQNVRHSPSRNLHALCSVQYLIVVVVVIFSTICFFFTIQRLANGQIVNNLFLQATVLCKQANKIQEYGLLVQEFKHVARHVYVLILF